jgi:hypothetical protein
VIPLERYSSVMSGSKGAGLTLFNQLACLIHHSRDLFARMSDQVGGRAESARFMRFVRNRSRSLLRERILSTAPQEQRVGVELVRKESRSTGVDGKGDVAEQILKGPAGSQMESDAAGGLADASA